MNRSTKHRLLLEYEGYIRSVARAHARDDDTADDMAQESIVKVLRSFRQLRDPERIKPWLRSIVRNTAKDWIRAQKRAPGRGFDPDNHPAPEKKSKPSMEGILEKLAPDYRRILLLKYFDDLSYAEIGRRLKMTPSAVGEKLWRIRRFLRLRLHRPERAFA